MTTFHAANRLSELLQGKYLKWGFQAEDGSADRSDAELFTFSHLYWLALEYGGEECEPVSDVYAFMTWKCNQYEYTEDGQKRKWGDRGEKLRRGLIQTALNTFEPEVFERIQRNKETPYRWNGKYSNTSEEAVIDSIRTLIEQHGEYPEGRQVRGFAQGLDPSRSEETHRGTLTQLRKKGVVCKACIEGENPVYYLPEMSDPPEAKSIMLGEENL